MAQGRELLERFGNAIRSDEEDLASFCTGDVEFTDSMATVTGIPALAEYLKTWWTAFPDASVTIGKLVESGDQAVGQMRYQGTQSGPLRGPQGEIPATGRSVDIGGAAWITVRDGKIARFEGFYDTGAMMMQLGLMPAPATA